MGRCDDGQYEGTQCGNDIAQGQCFQPILSQECQPLHLFLHILCKSISETQWGVISQRGLSTLEGGLNGLAKRLTIEVGVLRQYPEIEIILHATVGDDHLVSIAQKTGKVHFTYILIRGTVLFKY